MSFESVLPAAAIMTSVFVVVVDPIVASGLAASMLIRSLMASPLLRVVCEGLVRFSNPRRPLCWLMPPEDR